MPIFDFMDRSGTTAAANTSQVVMVKNENRRGFWVQNLSSADLWINDQGAATQSRPSMRIQPGSFYETPPGCSPIGAITIIGSAAGQDFSAREY